jgi:hypothetical protein
MTLFRILIMLVLVGLLGWCSKETKSPYRTALPLDTRDLSPIKPQLDKLPKADRELVLGYLERSKGDVLPAAMADPDSPFTARQFSEAIALQRAFLAKQAGQNAEARARQASRDEQLEPLRAALALHLIRREILTRDELNARPGAPESAYGAKRAHSGADSRGVLVTTYRLTNTAISDITSVTASITVRKSPRPTTELGILGSCYFTHDELLRKGDSTEIRCANMNQGAGAQAQDFVDMPTAEFDVEWVPKRIRFAGGRELSFED